MAKRAATQDVPVKVVPMGRALCIEYGTKAKAKRHHFTGKNVTLYRTADGTHLIIGPVKAGKEIHG